LLAASGRLPHLRWFTMKGRRGKN